MKHLFHCPACGRQHDEPADATFVLAVRCADCEIAEILAVRIVSVAAAPAVARVAA